MPAKDPVFVILQRNARGGITRNAAKEATKIAKGGVAFTLRKSPEKKILQELQALLPENVVLAGGNPFAVVKVTPTPSTQPQAGRCQCQCGTLTGSTTPCGGGGGGSGALV